tara:strand:- start:451 stop:1266 length:816 start_codon:yes stop_codon:yes gene_type:complete
LINLPKKLEKYLNDNSYKIVDVLQYSNWKYTYILKIIKNKEIYILKGFSPKTPIEIQKKFDNEINFYKHNQSKLFPKLINSSEFFLIIELINGQTLREYLKTGQVDDHFLKNIETLLDELYSESHKKLRGNLEVSFSNAYNHLYALLQSGPIQNKEAKINAFIKIRNKIFAVLLKIYLKILLSTLDQSKLKCGLLHGDLHYNNILVQKDKTIKFIDFENIKYGGFFDFDQLYLYSIIEKYLNSNFIFNIENEELIKIFKLYKFAISLNKRF